LFTYPQAREACGLDPNVNGLNRGTGARGLRAICEEVLNNVMFELPSRTDVEKVVIDAEAVRNKVLPTLVPRSSTPRVTRPRRAAS